MPAASSSRRRLVRRADMSDIEDDSTSMNPAQDDVEEIEAEPAPRKAKKEKGKGRAQIEAQVEPESDEDEIIDVRNFSDQPLKRDQLAILLRLADDWGKLSEVIGRPIPAFGETASALTEFRDNEDAKEAVDEIDALIRQNIDVRGVMKAHAEALQKLRQTGLQGEEIVGVLEAYIKDAKANAANYKRKTTRQKYAKQADYIAFRSSIWEVENPGTPMPPITDYIPREEGDNSDEDDDLEIGGVTQTYLCPITLTLLQDPYTSSVCGHSFSGDAIRATFRSPSTLNKCPAAGCAKSFRLADCKPDKALVKKVKAHKRRLERAEEHSDAEEVVD